MDFGLDAILKGTNSIRPQGVVTRQGTKAPRRSTDDTPWRSTFAANLKGTQGAALPLFGISPLSSLSRKVNRDLCKVMIEQAEADVALLMAIQILSAFKDLTTIIAVVAYPKFQEKLPRLPSKGLLECTLVKSVQVTCHANLLSSMLCLLFVKSLTLLTQFFLFKVPTKLL